MTDSSVTIDVEFRVNDPKLARQEAYSRGFSIFEPGPKDTVEVTYLSDGKQILEGWRFTASVTWTPPTSF